MSDTQLTDPRRDRRMTNLDIAYLIAEYRNFVVEHGDFQDECRLNDRGYIAIIDLIGVDKAEEEGLV